MRGGNKVLEGLLTACRSLPLAALLVTLFLALTAVQFVISAGTSGVRVLLSVTLDSPLYLHTWGDEA